jgi:hypothetical protein
MIKMSEEALLEVLTTEQLLMKAEGVKDCMKWIEEQIKNEKIHLKNEEKLVKDFGWFEDCGESYRNQVMVRKERISAMVGLKIGTEKYMRKLKHKANEN